MEKRILEQFRSLLNEIGIGDQPVVEDGMGVYLPLLEKWNRRVRLVGSADPAEVVLKHFADSMTLVPHLGTLPTDSRVLDLGSGAGFPGIPLALAYPDASIFLVESDGRKASFLAAACARLGLRNTKVIRARVEGKPQGEGVPSGDFVVSRALMDPERWLPLARAYVVDGGRVAAMMGAGALDEGRLHELGQRSSLRLDEVWRATLPTLGNRAIAVWRAVEA